MPSPAAPQPPAPENPVEDHRRRDTSILKLMGVFFIAFGVLVLLGIFWTQRPEGRVVNAGASLALVLVGGAFLGSGRRLSRSRRSS